ncbi:hypothetical protein KL86DPRO_30102 [uncultured delta proteobacterium]|uniref:Uncharacterized protein n=1 Tax=uncultured delta proteobacterium TaxID=34034 RepID=A0A212K7W4_9DELT|nr:hypothetical protein KL86DPRO_30102 [uncultured delta proteobacterium]
MSEWSHLLFCPRRERRQKKAASLGRPLFQQERNNFTLPLKVTLASLERPAYYYDNVAHDRRDSGCRLSVTRGCAVYGT